LNNRKIQNLIAAVVIILALIALFSQNKIEDWWREYSFTNDPRPVIAHIETLHNEVQYRPPESLVYHRAKTEMPLHAKDTVATDSSSSAVIAFNNGLKVELQPNSLIIIEDFTSGGGNIELSFLRGNVKVLNQADGVKLKGTSLKREKVAANDNEPKDEEPIKLDFAMLEKAPTPPPAMVPKVELEEKTAKFKPTPAPHKHFDNKETLPDSYIASVIKNQRTFLNRCYAQHLRLNPDAHGRIDTSLTIEPDGTISTARVIGSTIPDPALQQCVVSTLQRARFKAFNGDPIIVTYPINFE
jgi:hypothetical protein